MWEIIKNKNFKLPIKLNGFSVTLTKNEIIGLLKRLSLDGIGINFIKPNTIEVGRKENSEAVRKKIEAWLLKNCKIKLKWS